MFCFVPWILRAVKTCTICSMPNDNEIHYCGRFHKSWNLSLFHRYVNAKIIGPKKLVKDERIAIQLIHPTSSLWEIDRSYVLPFNTSYLKLFPFCQKIMEIFLNSHFSFRDILKEAFHSLSFVRLSFKIILESAQL